MGLSPPVKDSGSSLTTVTTLTDQGAIGSGMGSDSDRRRYSFDLGFLDILTIDSNSSVADQLSTGRVSELSLLPSFPDYRPHFSPFSDNFWKLTG
jgi:hypothetical protein